MLLSTVHFAFTEAVTRDLLLNQGIKQEINVLTVKLDEYLHQKYTHVSPKHLTALLLILNQSSGTSQKGLGWRDLKAHSVPTLCHGHMNINSELEPSSD